MAAVVIEIADAVAASLEAASEAGDLSLRFQVEREYDPTLELKDMGDDIFLTVIPAELSMAILTRGSDDFTYVVHVAVRRRVGQGAATREEIKAASDPLMRLAEEVMDLFRGHVAADFAPARFSMATNAPIFDMQEYRTFRTFFSLIALGFKRARSK